MSHPPLSEIVPEYHSSNPLVRWLFRKRLTEALRLARLEGPMDVLDLGCGEGLLLRLLHTEHPALRLTGVDHNPGVTELSISGATVRQGDITDPECLPADSFDRIFCMDVLEHFEDLGAPLGAIRGALRAGGLLILSAPTENLLHKTCRFLIKGTFSEKEGPASSPHFHRAATLTRAIAAAGFEPVADIPLPLPGPLALNRVLAFRKP